MNFHDEVIGIIGCGNMGSALVEHLEKKFSPKAIFIFDKDKNKEKSLVKRFHVKSVVDINQLVLDSDVIIVAVKPQDIDVVLKEMKGILGKLIISIAAGVKIFHLESVLGPDNALVRAMPNLNALIGAGVTALSFNTAVTQAGRVLAEQIFQSVGDVVFVEEKQLNSVTAISGSGPAFVAYLISELGEGVLKEALTREAVKLGIEPQTAKVLAYATVVGTRQILRVNFDADMFIKRVCSKGGTTEAGMRVLMEKGKTLEALSEAVKAAKKRADELSG